MAFVVTPTIAAGIGLAAIGAGAGVAVAASQPKPTTSPSVSMPQAPKIGDAQAKAQEAMVQRRKAVGRHKGIHTSPLGIAGEAQVAKKTLLGQ